MNWDQIEGKWDQYKAVVKQKWAKLTDDDISLIGGKKDELIGRVKERYGLAKEKAEAQIDEWTRSINRDKDDDSPSYPPTGGNSRGNFGGGMQAAGREGEGSGTGGSGTGGSGTGGSGTGGSGSGGGGREGGREGGKENTGREGQDRQGQGGGQRDQGGGQRDQGGQPDRSGNRGGGQEPGKDPNRDAVREPKKS